MVTVVCGGSSGCDGGPTAAAVEAKAFVAVVTKAQEAAADAVEGLPRPGRSDALVRLPSNWMLAHAGPQ